MLVNYHAIEIMVRESQNQMAEEVKNNRIIHQYKNTQPKVKDRILLSLGRHLIDAGLKLQNQTKPALDLCPDDYQTCCGRV